MNSIKPYDLGKNLTNLNYQKIDIDNIIKNYHQIAKSEFIRSKVSIRDLTIKLSISKTRFNGQRYWFSCPNCHRRIRIIYIDPINKKIGCIKCLKIKYYKSRYKGMIETNPP